MFMLISNKPIKVAYLQKLANKLSNAEWHTGDRSFSESKKNGGRLIIVTRKNLRAAIVYVIARLFC